MKRGLYAGLMSDYAMVLAKAPARPTGRPQIPTQSKPRKRTPRLSDRLPEIAHWLGLDVKGVRYHRLFPGHWQRSDGAWCWEAVDEEGNILFGSADKLADIVEALDGDYLSESERDWRSLYADKPPSRK